MTWQTTHIRHTTAIEPDYPANMRYAHLITIEWEAENGIGRECVIGFGPTVFTSEQDAYRQKADWMRWMDTQEGCAS